MNLAEISCKCVSVLVDTVKTLFSGFVNAAEAVGKIDELETEADHLEAQLIDLRPLDLHERLNLVETLDVLLVIDAKPEAGDHHHDRDERVYEKLHA